RQLCLRTHQSCLACEGRPEGKLPSGCRILCQVDGQSARADSRTNLLHGSAEGVGRSSVLKSSKRISEVGGYFNRGVSLRMISAFAMAMCERALFSDLPNWAISRFRRK